MTIFEGLGFYIGKWISEQSKYTQICVCILYSLVIVFMVFKMLGVL